MLEIVVPEKELYDDKTGEFIEVKEQKLQLEHSLISLSKWESKWCKAFLSKRDVSPEELIDYVRCMTLTKNVDPYVYLNLSEDNIKTIEDYLKAPMTATHFLESSKNPVHNSETITSELIYYWMITLGIPVEFEKWHLTRLLTLIKVCNLKNNTKKMSKGEIARRNRMLNADRRKKFNTKG